MQVLRWSRHFRWKDAFLDEGLAYRHAFQMVDFQNRNCRSPDRGFPHEDSPLPTEVAIPLVPARIEELREFPGLGIHASNVGPLVIVARETRQSEVARDGRSSMFESEYMIDLVGEAIVLLV